MENKFYLYLIIIDLLILALPLLFFLFPPKKINQWYGYRTRSAMQNQRTWEIAQKLSRKYISFFSILILSIQVPLIIFNYRSSLFITLVLWVLSLLITLFIIERKLKKLSE